MTLSAAAASIGSGLLAAVSNPSAGSELLLADLAEGLVVEQHVLDTDPVLHRGGESGGVLAEAAVPGGVTRGQLSSIVAMVPADPGAEQTPAAVPGLDPEEVRTSAAGDANRT